MACSYCCWISVVRSDCYQEIIPHQSSKKTSTLYELQFSNTVVLAPRRTIDGYRTISAMKCHPSITLNRSRHQNS
eukprot:g51664.t1